MKYPALVVAMTLIVTRPATAQMSGVELRNGDVYLSGYIWCCPP